MFKVNVSPDMGMYHLLRSQGYDPAYAVAEFIDNALQAHFTHAEQSGIPASTLEISLKFYSSDFANQKKHNSIVIVDKGPGITKARLADAMKPAKAAPQKGLSEFGIGMKAAAVWFSDKWALCTKPTDSTKQYDLLFNLTALLDAGTNQVKVKEQERANTEEAGTTITLHQLRRPIDKDRYDLICKDLLDLYQLYTEGALPRLKLTAYFNDTPKPLQYVPGDRSVLKASKYKTIGKQSYAIGKEHEWTVPVNMVFQGVRIEGHVDIRETGSYVDNPGIVMFRGDRVITGTIRQPNLPKALFKTSNKYARQRVYGRLFTDGLPVVYTKDAFEIDEKAFWEQLRAVEGMEDLLIQAEHYRVRGNPITVKKEADIPGGKTKPTSAAANKAKIKSTEKPKPKPQNTKPKEPPPPLIALLSELKPKASALSLQAMIDETIYLHQIRREVATAMCLRSVLELAVLERIKKDYASHYPNVSDMGIKKLLGYVNARLTDFFDKKNDHDVIKCVQGTADGTQIDVVLLNNAAHGTFHPMLHDINIFIRNLEPLLRWALK